MHSSEYLIDFYKAGHSQQYPKKTTRIVSNFTPRSNKHANVDSDGVVFFGLQHFIEDYLWRGWGEFFRKDKKTVLDEYQEFMDNSLGPNAVTTDHLGKLHDLHYLPLEIRAVPEGTLVPFNVPAMTVHNTLPEFYWLTNYIESALSAYMWLPCTSATTARHYRKMFDYYADLTGTDPAFVDFQGHDFSFRGMSGPEAAARSGAGHLVFFKGTDSVPSIRLINEDYYGKSCVEFTPGSVPATEHSVMCAGSPDDEFRTFERLITEVYPTGIVSIVSDTWDLWRVLDDYMPRLKEKILNRPGKVVIRADSGNPVDIICGPLNDPGHSVLGKLANTFGTTKTSKGFDLLDEHVGAIYGDFITPTIASDMLHRMANLGWASGNIVLGIGSYTYQYVTRDTWGFAMKATYAEIDGKPTPLFKDPVTDDGVKKSHLGLPYVKPDLTLSENVDWNMFVSHGNMLRPVWRNGASMYSSVFDTIRNTARATIR